MDHLKASYMQRSQKLAQNVILASLSPSTWGLAACGMTTISLSINIHKSVIILTISGAEISTFSCGPASIRMHAYLGAHDSESDPNGH